MENHIRLNSAMAMLTQATSINHVFDEDAAELGCSPIHYALELDDRLYLVCRDDDTNKMVVVPIEHWEVGNLLEAIDDPLSVLSFREIDSEGLEKVASFTSFHCFRLLGPPWIKNGQQSSGQDSHTHFESLTRTMTDSPGRAAVTKWAKC